jgi:succinyl-CoA synthetase beta subunit
MFYAEKEAKKILEKDGFDVLESYYIKNLNDLKKYNFDFPVVIKISGKNIVHKKKIGGVKVGIKDYDNLEKDFNILRKIKGFEEAIVQKQISGKEFFIGIKKTPDFGHVVVFGKGGSDVENKRDVSFRVYPLDKNDIYEMIKETKISKELSNKDVNLIYDNISKINSFIKKHPKIAELDINPLIISNGRAFVVDARIVSD